MVFLKGKKLIDYLVDLESEVEKLKNNSTDDFSKVVHNQMIAIIQAERKFTDWTSGICPELGLSFSINGFPSVHSLNPDLNKMGDLSEGDSLFLNISQKFKYGSTDYDKKQFAYTPLTEKEWNKEFEKRVKNDLVLKTGFSIDETEDGKLELALTENFFLRGYENYSEKIPVLVREGKAQYQIALGVLFDNFKSNFYVNRNVRGSLPLGKIGASNFVIREINNVFKPIKSYLIFGVGDHEIVCNESEGHKYKLTGKSNYHNVIGEGTERRVDITKKLLSKFTELYEKKISLDGINTDNLEGALSFYWVPMKNSEEVLFDNNIFEVREEFKKYGYAVNQLYNPFSGKYDFQDDPTRTKKRVKSMFDLVSIQNSEKIGEITYIPPFAFLELIPGSYTDYKGCLSLGGIYLKINSSSIDNEHQYEEIEKYLQKNEFVDSTDMRFKQLEEGNTFYWNEK